MGSAACRERVVALRPTDPNLHSDYLHLLHYDPSRSPEDLYRHTIDWARRHVEHLYPAVPTHANAPDPYKLLRVGYVSGDFRAHPVTKFLSPVLAAHDRARFVIYCYSHVAKPDQLTARVRRYADVWRDTRNLDCGQLADLVRRDGIDVLVDLTGHLGEHRLQAFARWPAPVQVNYIGYFATTGVNPIQYRFTDAWHDPPGVTDPYYTETLVRLDRCCWCYDPGPTPEVNDLPALAKGHVTFGVLNRLVKVTDGMIRLWGRILARLPGAKLLLLAEPGCAKDHRLGDRFRAGGVDPRRMILAPRRPRKHYLALSHGIDVMLDTSPYAGMTTTCDALYMGVPTVTLAGKTHVSRVGVSLMNAVGLPELVAETEDQYVEAAVKLATDLPRLAELRRGLRDRMKASTLMDGEGLARRIEAAYRDMWRTWCAKQTPA